MGVVVDSSVAACWFLPDEYSDLANRTLDLVGKEGMTAPTLLRYELQNVLLMNERRQRIIPSQVEEGFRRFAALSITFLQEFDPSFVAQIVRRHDLSAYDAAYVDAALRRGLPLATLDKRMAQAAIAEGLSVIM